MNRTHLIEKVSQDVKVSKSQADRLLDSLFSAVAESLKRGEKVMIKDFGRWEVSALKPRQGIHPKTGAPITIQAKNRPRFVPGKRLLKVLNRQETK